MDWADAIVIGPGLGTDRNADKILKYVISKSEVPIVIDADGINTLSNCIELLKQSKIVFLLIFYG